MRGFVTVRISSILFGTTGRFLDGGHPLDFGKLLESNVVLEIEDCGDDRDKAFLTGAVLIRLAEYLRMRQRAEGPAPARLRHLTVVEEAHRLLRQPPPGTGSGPAAHAVEVFAGLLAEIRAYGEGLIIAEQIPSKLIPWGRRTVSGARGYGPAHPSGRRRARSRSRPPSCSASRH